MQCQYIITGIERFEGAPEPAESFFVVTPQSLSLGALQEAFGSLIFDPLDTEIFFEEILKDPENNNYALLISLDGTRGKFRYAYGGKVKLESELEELHPFYPRGEGEPLGVEGDYEKFLNCLNVEVESNPAKAIEYNYWPDPCGWLIPDRFDFQWIPASFGPESLDSEIQAAARNPEAGSDDAIALLYICRDLNLHLNGYDPEQIADEVEVRLAKKISFRAHFLSFSELTLEELNQRSLRAKWYLRKFQEAVVHVAYEDGHDVAAMRYLRGLDNDVLAELAVVAFYTGVEMKPVAMVLSERFREPHHF